MVEKRAASNHQITISSAPIWAYKTKKTLPKSTRKPIKRLNSSKRSINAPTII